MLNVLALALLQTTWVVDAAGSPGSNFTNLPPAIAAAANGDTILVLPGSYSAISIDGKALTIRGAGAALTTVNGPTHLLLQTPAGSANTLSGLTLNGFLHAALGSRLTLIDCEIRGANQAINGGAALGVTQSEVFALRCRFTGGDAVGPPPPPPFGGPMSGGPAVTVQIAKFHASECELIGGNLAGVFAGLGARLGGVGLTVVDFSRARIDACDITGGDSGPTGSAVGTGGDAVFVRNGTQLQLVGGATEVVGPGAGVFPGASIRLTNERFYPASDVVVHGAVTLSGSTIGPVTTNGPALPHAVVTATTLPSGETQSALPVQIALDGQSASAPFALLLAPRPAYTASLPPLFGDLLVDASTTAVLLGQLDPAGRFQVSIVPLAIFGGALPFPLFLQFAVFDGNGDVRLSNLDARYYSL